MITEFNEYIKEYWDWKNMFRGGDNPNVVADELFKAIKKDIKEYVYILTSVNIVEDGFLEMTLPNKSKLKIILVYDNDESVEGIVTLKPNRKPEIQLVIDFNKAQRYYDYIISKSISKKDKAIKAKNAKDIRDAIRKK